MPDTEPDLIDAMLSAYVDIMDPITPKAEWDREPRRKAIRAAARVMLERMREGRRTPGWRTTLERFADEHGLK